VALHECISQVTQIRDFDNLKTVCAQLEVRFHLLRFPHSTAVCLAVQRELAEMKSFGYKNGWQHHTRGIGVIQDTKHTKSRVCNLHTLLCIVCIFLNSAKTRES